MRLTATVVALEDMSRFTDNKPRILLRVKEADSFARELRVPVESLDRIVLGMTVDVNIPSLFDRPVEHAPENECA